MRRTYLPTPAEQCTRTGGLRFMTGGGAATADADAAAALAFLALVIVVVAPVAPDASRVATCCRSAAISSRKSM